MSRLMPDGFWAFLRRHRPSRRYSALDIRSMRSSLWALNDPGAMVAFNREEVAARIESQLLTYIAAGVDPEDLHAMARESWSSATDA